MEHHTAGDPINGLRWTRKTTLKISAELHKAGIVVSPKTVARLLRGLKFSLRVNHKKVAGKSSPFRNQQFEYINRMRRRFERQGWPAISIDTKKRELVGRFKNAGTTWETTPVLVNDHDFRTAAQGVAIPWGLYDTQANRGHVFIGTSHDTPAFSVTALAQWWISAGRRRYPYTKRLLILADCGGSNGARTRAWKYELQTRLCDRFGLTLTVCHYPPGTSKWNPIEHRLFSEISKNWAGQPLENYETVLNFIRTTKTLTGLVVNATLLDGDYPTGIKISDTKMDQVNLRPHRVHPMWNYTLVPARSKM
jgi:Rhodopirellula transposase DDE domain